ncbi:ESX secretion-associated protein EspG [Amycolatopsis benzoatilytica]|uniref:ESX secretion-associated protein EspG n=1 Tax=Amycolatopsis benzoatilytica TaxID=346045 RepID=UPI00035C1952|nr:ESX secretion-associated protein EspG [Amycolatopsis benzoatilytica]
MPYSFTLSPAAVDLLLAELGLGRAPVPFVVPHIGITGDERAAVRDAVMRDLDGRGLLRRGSVDDDVEIALATFARPSIAVSAAAKLGDEQLFARVASNGANYAVLVVHRDGMFTFEEVRPTGIVPAIVDLLPLTPAAPGQSVTVARPAKKPVRGDAYDPFAGVSGPRTHNPQLRAVERIFEKPRLAVGQFTVHIGDGRGHEQSLPSLAWFDTELGRYLLSTRDASDGQRWLTYAPADNARLAQQLFTQLEGYSANA